MSEMRAGLALDERLCELLEPLASLRWLAEPIAPLGFWEWHKGYSSLTDKWVPIPVSTDWAAMGKAVIAVQQFARVDMVCYKPHIHSHPSPSTVAIHQTVSPILVEADGDTLPHALTLAAIEALERRKDED